MLPAQKHTLETLLADAVKQVAKALEGAAESAFVEPTITLERPKVAAHGDVACNVAMQLAKPLRANPRQLARQIVDAALALPAAAGLVEAAEVAGPGSGEALLAPAPSMRSWSSSWNPSVRFQCTVAEASARTRTIVSPA